MSQPAISHSLNKLRVLLEDPLLIRQCNEVVLSSLAQNLQAPLKAGCCSANAATLAIRGQAASDTLNRCAAYTCGIRYTSARPGSGPKQ